MNWTNINVPEITEYESRNFATQAGFDDVTALLCGSLQTHLGTSMPSGGGYIIKAIGAYQKGRQPKYFIYKIPPLKMP